MTKSTMPEIDWDRVRDEVVGHLSALIRLDTTNPPGNETIAAEYLARALHSEGVQPTLLEHAPGRGNLVARLPGDGSASPLLLYGHTDVVAAEPERWTHGPFSGDVADGFVWGRGAVDMKGMLAMSLLTVLLLKRTGARLKRDLIFAATADEEVAGAGIRFLVEKHPDLIRADWGITEVGGFSQHVGERRVYAIQTGEKGALWLKVRAQGKPGHASQPHGDNAVVHLARGLARLARRGMPYHLTSPVAAHIDALAAALGGREAALLRTLKHPLTARLALKWLSDETMARTFNALLRNTATPTGLTAGKKTNVIPSTAEAVIDCRVLPGFTAEQVMAELARALGPGFEYEVIINSPPLAVAHDTPLFHTIRQTLLRRDPGAAVLPYLMTGATDAKYTAALNMRTYGFSPMRLPRGFRVWELFHGHDERAPVDGLGWGVQVLFETVRDFCANPAGG